MPTITAVNAIKNINSQAVFILLKQEPDNKMTIINPEGKVLTVPEGLFERPFLVKSEVFATTFTNKQILAIDKNLNKKRVTSSSASSATKKTRRKKAETPKFGIGAEWNSSRLTFYKHKIDPLMDTQSFKVTIEGVGIFTIIKSEFSRLFNEVVIASSYWKEGSYTYDELPEKAKKFIQIA